MDDISPDKHQRNKKHKTKVSNVVPSPSRPPDLTQNITCFSLFSA